MSCVQIETLCETKPFCFSMFEMSQVGPHLGEEVLLNVLKRPLLLFTVQGLFFCKICYVCEKVMLSLSLLNDSKLCLVMFNYDMEA